MSEISDKVDSFVEGVAETFLSLRRAIRVNDERGNYQVIAVVAVAITSKRDGLLVVGMTISKSADIKHLIETLGKRVVG